MRKSQVRKNRILNFNFFRNKFLKEKTTAKLGFFLKNLQKKQKF